MSLMIIRDCSVESTRNHNKHMNYPYATFRGKPIYARYSSSPDCFDEEAQGCKHEQHINILGGSDFVFFPLEFSNPELNPHNYY